MRPILSLVIPAFNEEARIESTLRAYHAYLVGLGLRFEIVVVDDGSSDTTVELVQRLGAELGGVHCIASRPNRGKGHAVRVGMLASVGDVRIMADADGSMPPSQLPHLLEPLARGQHQVAIGSRYLDRASGSDQPWWRRAWSRLANAVVRRTLVPGIRDTQCGFKAFTADAAETIFSRATIDGWAFDLEVLAIARQNEIPVLECPVEWADDERSRIRAGRDLWAVVREWHLIRRRLTRGDYRRARLRGSASLTA